MRVRSLFEVFHQSFCCLIWTPVKLGNVPQRGQDEEPDSKLHFSFFLPWKAQNQVFAQREFPGVLVDHQLHSRVLETLLITQLGG